MASKGAGLYGFVPYLLATMAGKVTGDVGRMTEAGRILRRLDVPANQKYLHLRTEVPPTRTYDYPSQDDLYSAPKGSQGPSFPPSGAGELEEETPETPQSKAETIRRIPQRGKTRQ